jgi:TrmH family RNA methyltransferase
MLSKAQEKLIRSLATKKGRQEAQRLLVEGAKNVREAAPHVDFTFTPADTPDFAKLLDTETPQDIAAVAKLPHWRLADVEGRRTIVLLDGVQDPGNVGSILRLCLGFDASVILVESADATAPKVVRSSAGAVFRCPWITMSRAAAEHFLTSPNHPVIRMEKTATAGNIGLIEECEEAIIVFGSEGQGIKLKSPGLSVAIRHNEALESLNVAHAVAIALHGRYAYYNGRG